VLVVLWFAVSLSIVEVTVAPPPAAANSNSSFVALYVTTWVSVGEVNSAIGRATTAISSPSKYFIIP